MIKEDVIKKIVQKTGISKLDVQLIIEAYFSVTKAAMIEGNNIYIRGFGSFVNKKKAKRVARNIQQNKAMVVSEHYAPSFKPSKIFVNQVKNSKKVSMANR